MDTSINKENKTKFCTTQTLYSMTTTFQWLSHLLQVLHTYALWDFLLVLILKLMTVIETPSLSNICLLGTFFIFLTFFIIYTRQYLCLYLFHLNYIISSLTIRKLTWVLSYFILNVSTSTLKKWWKRFLKPLIMRGQALYHF